MRCCALPNSADFGTRSPCNMSDNSSRDRDFVVQFISLVLLCNRQQRNQKQNPSRTRLAYSTSRFSGQMRLMEVLNNRARCMNAFGMSPSAMRLLASKLGTAGRSLATQRVGSQETLAIALHALRHGTGHRQTGLEFNRSLAAVSR